MSRETSEIAIGKEFARLGNINKHVILSLISLQAAQSACLRLLRLIEEKNVFEEDLTDELVIIEKIHKMIPDLMWEQGKYSFDDLRTTIEGGPFSQDMKNLFKTYLTLMGISELR